MSTRPWTREDIAELALRLRDLDADGGPQLAGTTIDDVRRYAQVVHDAATVECIDSVENAPAIYELARDRLLSGAVVPREFPTRVAVRRALVAE